jgi:hypothetical protein
MADSSADRLAQRHARAKATPNDDAPAQDGAPRRRALLLWGVAALVLLAGYADLARGGETIAPILLVLGYCVAVPLAILRG